MGFEPCRSTIQTTYAGAGCNTANNWGNEMILPRGVYHNRGVATSSLAFQPPNGWNGNGTIGGGCFTLSVNLDGSAEGVAYGNHGGGSNNGGGTYTAGTTTTRAVWAAAQGHQLGIQRSVVGIGNEV